MQRFNKNNENNTFQCYSDMFSRIQLHFISIKIENISILGHHGKTG